MILQRPEIANALNTSAQPEIAHKKCTLSNPATEGLPNRSIMCPIRNSSELWSRSEGHSGEEAASHVTIENDASHQFSVGAGVAAESPARQMKSGVDFVSEINFAGDAAAKPKQKIDGEEIENELAVIQECLATVKSGRAVIMIDADERKYRQDTKPGKSTSKTYSAKCELIDGMMNEGDEPKKVKLLRALARYAHSSGSFGTMRSAFKQRALDRIRSLLKAQDDLQRDKKTIAWIKCVDKLAVAIVEFEYVNAATREVCLEYSERTPKSPDSKCDDLRLLLPTWRDIFLDESNQSSRYRVAVMLHRHCGLRPFELATGATLQLVGDVVTVTISGAKLRDTAGQLLRSIALDLKMLPQWFRDVFPADGRLVVAANEACLRSHLRRISERVRGRIWKSAQARNRNGVISGFSFRHALVSDMRESGWTEEEIAAAIGERVADTTKHYGERRKRSGKVGPRLAAIRGKVETTTPVRPRDPTKLDRVIKQAAKKSNRPTI